MSPQIFSFFSGAGFLDLGFEKSGYNIVFANELCEDFAQVYRHARSVMGITEPMFGLSECSIEDFLEDKKATLIHNMNEAKKSGELIGFIGGPPCPDFSVAGKNAGASGKHGVLSQVYMDLICDTQPDFFLFENVKGLWRTARHRAFFDQLQTQAKAAGYCLTRKLVNSLEYGAPQDRDRILLIGIHESVLKTIPTDRELSDFEWLSPDALSVEQIKALPWPTRNPFGISPECPNNILEQQTVAYWFNKNDVAHHPNRNDFFVPRAGLAKMQVIDEGDDCKKSYKRLHRWRFSPTVCYGNNEVHLHPWLPRRLSVAEALALQSLPKEFELPKNMSLSSKFKTIGNGVPFVLSKAIAERLKRYLESHAH